MTEVERKPNAPGTFTELTSQTGDPNWEEVQTDDGATSGVYLASGPLFTELKDTYKIKIPDTTFKVKVVTKTTNFGLGAGNARPIIYHGESLTEGTKAPVSGWTVIEEEFVGNFSGEFEIGVSLEREASGLIFTTQVYAVVYYIKKGLADRLVAKHGETVKHWKVTEAVFNDYDDYDPEASTIDETDIKAVVSRPDERHVVKVVGREIDADLAITIDHEYDISPSRSGIPDRILYDGLWYNVHHVQSIRHPFVNDNKKLVLLEL